MGIEGRHVSGWWPLSRPLPYLMMVIAACGGDVPPPGSITEPTPEVGRRNCTIDPSRIFSAAPAKDWIPALTNPLFVEPGHADLSYLRDFDRVVGLEIDGRPYAIPVNILWWHEIVNLDLGGASLAVTHCPLTGSSLVFDRAPLGGVEFGVSGLLYFNNLIMYDRSTGESLWPQMLRGARCGAQAGTSLQSVPALEMRWDRWRELHPGTRVVSERTGFERSYDIYPDADYAQPRNEATLFARRVDDTRRPPKELVFGIPDDTDPIAIPFGVLESMGPLAAVHPSLAEPGLVILWDRAGEVAAAYRTPLVEGRFLRLEVVDGRIEDTETGSAWRVDGRAVSGPLTGTRLDPVAEAYVAFWFAWIDFHPGTRLLEAN